MAGNQEWLEARRKGIGASEIGILMGAEAFGKDQIDLYLDKVGTPIQTEEEISAFRRGHRYEPHALSDAEKKLGIKINKACEGDWRDFFFQCPGHPIVQCTLDGTTEEKPARRVEAKCPVPQELARIINYGIPVLYWWQSQAQMACCPDAEHIIFVVYDIIEADVHIFYIDRDKPAIEQMIATAEEWWEKYVLTKTPPTRNIATPTVSAPKQKGKYIEMDSVQWLSLKDEYVNLKERLSVSDSDYKRIKKVFQDAMIDAGITHLSIAGHKFQCLEIDGRITLDKRLLLHEHPEIDLSKYESRGKSFYQFKDYPPKRR